MATEVDAKREDQSNHDESIQEAVMSNLGNLAIQGTEEDIKRLQLILEARAFMNGLHIFILDPHGSGKCWKCEEPGFAHIRAFKSEIKSITEVNESANA